MQETMGNQQQKLTALKRLELQQLLDSLPVHASHALLYDTSDLLEHIGVLLINPMGQISTIIQDLENTKRRKGGEGEGGKAVSLLSTARKLGHS